ncbi:hypothetical protein [Pontibacter ruber]|uniref:TIGR02588 family protein n=1 Tax=Pontibacter ruber TaxID=1343895 RepID=A0ABW5CZB3_9BACT|nr:hypothetical protein [Pontibacter ruber]
MEKTKRKYREGDDSKNPLEWTVFAVSLLLIVSILGYLGHQAYTYVPTSPDIQVKYRPDPSVQAPYRYHVSIINLGNQTAEEVLVELALKRGSDELETAELQIPFAPKESEREGWVTFKTNPATADTVAARVMSYKKP